jgi:hypothetical protein
VPTGDVTRYEFLSNEWLSAVAELRENESIPHAVIAPVTVNLVVTDAPFSTEQVLAHVDTTAGSLLIDGGLLERADVTITVAWATAKALLVEGNQQAAMSAFLEGKVRVEGDVGKLLAFQSGVADQAARETAARIRAFTA